MHAFPQNTKTGLGLTPELSRFNQEVAKTMKSFWNRYRLTFSQQHLESREDSFAFCTSSSWNAMRESRNRQRQYAQAYKGNSKLPVHMRGRTLDRVSFREIAIEFSTGRKGGRSVSNGDVRWVSSGENRFGSEGRRLNQHRATSTLPSPSSLHSTFCSRSCSGEALLRVRVRVRGGWRRSMADKIQ